MANITEFKLNTLDGSTTTEYSDGVVKSGSIVPATEMNAADVARVRFAALLGRPSSYTLSASPPTITVSADDAATSLSNPVAIPLSQIDQWPIPPSGKLTPALIIDNSPEGAGHTGATVRAVVNYFVATDAARVEIAYRPDGTNSNLILWVDGQRVSDVIVGGAFNNKVKRILIDFGGRKLRQIEINGMRVPFESISVERTDSIVAPTVPPLRATIIGDSFTEGTGASAIILGLAHRIGRQLGIRRTAVSGLGGTGYSGTSNGARKRLRHRFMTDIAPYPTDVVFWMNGVNDGAAGSLLTLQADTEAAFDMAQQVFPSAQHIVFGPFNPRGSGSTVVRDLIRAAVGSRSNFTFVDTLALNEITGGGYVNGPTGIGNSDWVTGGVDGSDQTHPTTAGHAYLADWRVEAVRKFTTLFPLA